MSLKLNKGRKGQIQTQRKWKRNLAVGHTLEDGQYMGPDKPQLRQEVNAEESMNYKYHEPRTSEMTFGPPLLNSWSQI